MVNKKDSEREASFLRQMVISLDQAELKLEEAYRKKKPEQFKSIKIFILKLNKRIAEALE